jgi:hypothetical protein
MTHRYHVMAGAGPPSTSSVPPVSNEVDAHTGRPSGQALRRHEAQECRSRVRIPGQWQKCYGSGLLALSVMLLSVAANAQSDRSRLAAQLDRPVAVRKVAPKSSDDPNGQLVCTFYQDLMIRESGTDTPAPNAAVVLPLPAAQARPACDATHRNNEVALKTEGFSFAGRKDQFLLFSATDPNGAVPFVVIDAGSGRIVFEDGTPADRGLQGIAVEHGNLHLRYRRAFNAPCSIMQNAATCWSQLIAAGKLPHSMEQSVPSPQLCAASYKADKAPPNDPSIIAYDVETVVDPAGQAQVTPRGPVSCAPVP